MAGMTTLRYARTKTTTEQVEKAVPVEFIFDDTPRGQAVDAYLEAVHGKRRERDGSFRDQLYSDNADVVETTIANLTHAYAVVDLLAQILKEA